MGIDEIGINEMRISRREKNEKWDAKKNKSYGHPTFLDDGKVLLFYCINIFRIKSYLRPRPLFSSSCEAIKSMPLGLTAVEKTICVWVLPNS